jgi:hypothetical protein
MAIEDPKGNFTAFFSVDMAGCSRLMGEDEEARVGSLTHYWELMVTVSQKHRGRVFHSPCDNLLTVF